MSYPTTPEEIGLQRASEHRAEQVSLLKRLIKTTRGIGWTLVVLFVLAGINSFFADPLHSLFTGAGKPAADVIRQEAVTLSGKDKPKPDFTTVIDIQYLDRVDGTYYFTGYALRDDGLPLRILMHSNDNEFGYQGWPEL